MPVIYMDRASIESLTEKDIREIIDENSTDVKYGMLHDYYVGNHRILGENKKDSTAPNNRLVNNMAKYITDTATGYFVGEPIVYDSQNDEYLQTVQDIFDYNDEQDHNMELAKQCSICGSCFEMLYLDEDAKIRLARVPAANGIMICETDSGFSTPMAFIRTIISKDKDDNVIRKVEFWNSSLVMRFQSLNNGYLNMIAVEEHYWQDVPFVEYINNEERLGDFEGVITEIDAYNKVQSKGRYAAERLVRTESSYFSNQGELASYREMGIQEYTFLGGGCEICMELNGQSFPLDEAEPGLNLPPIHPNCKCTIKAKAKIDLFKDREGVNPLESNPKFEEWKKKYVDTPAPEPIIKLSENEQHAINSYISSEAYTWNDKLRRGVKLTKEEKKQISNLDSALQKMPTYQGVLYRSVSDFGIPDVQEFIVGHKPGMEISFPEFLSSSTEVYDDSFPIQYVITSKTGRDIRKFNSQEKEILFERDSMFYISKVVNNVIYMEEI